MSDSDPRSDRGPRTPALTRRTLLRIAGGAAAGLVWPSCKRSEPEPAAPTAAAKAPAPAAAAAAPAAPAAPQPVAAPAGPVDLVASNPIAEVTAAATGFLGDDFTRPHGALWDRDGYLAAHGGVPAPREKTDLVVVGGGVSGLGLAYRLRDRKPIVLEQATRFGGNAKGERWNGITYSLGAAYFAKTEPTNPLHASFYGPLGVDKLWREIHDEPVVRDGKILTGFWAGVTDPPRKAQFEKAEAYFKNVLKNAYPSLPNEPGDALPEAELHALDRRSTRDELRRALGADLHPHVEVLADHYCWSTFCGGYDEVSAAAFLCAFAAEFDGIVALPGGNSTVARRLVEELHASCGPTNLRPQTLVLRVAIVGDAVHVTSIDPAGALYTIEAKAVVLACPKFVAKKIVVGLPEDQLAAMNRVRYRGYVVANALVAAPAPAEAYDLYLLDDHDGRPTAELAPTHGATDVLVGHWAQGGHPTHSVLTLYSPLPYDAGRATLFDPNAFERVSKELRAQLPAALALVGLEPEQLTELRIARWGHAMNLSAVGQLADGTWATARRPVGGRVFFVEQDNWPAPAIETAFLCALREEPAVRKALG